MIGRRAILAMALAALAAPSVSFAGVTPERRRELLGDAWKRATKAGRPLLVVVVPDDPGAWYDRGRTLGIWLNHVEEADLEALAGVEPACATLDELGRLVPGVVDAGQPWFVLVRVDAGAPTWRSVVVPTATGPRVQDFDDYAVQHAGEGDPEETFERWRATERAQGQAEIEATRASFRGAVLRVLAAEGVARGAADVGRARWVTAAPPGAHWGHATGCGSWYERGNGADDPAIYNLCGMGHVAPHAERFLAFWEVD